jgi:hypothetical protein
MSERNHPTAPVRWLVLAAKTMLNWAGFGQRESPIDAPPGRRTGVTSTASTHPWFVVVGCVLLLLSAGAVVPGGAAPVGTAAAQESNGTAAPGAIVGDGVADGGRSVGRPVESPDATFGGRFYLRVSSVAGAYNEERPELGLAGGLVTGSVVNFHVTTADGETAVFSFRLTEDNRIEDLRAGPRSDADIRMTTDKATFDRIATAESPGAAFREALASREIRIGGRGPVSAVFWGVVNLLRTLGGFL